MKMGLFASIFPPIFIGMGEFLKNRIPEDTKKHPLLELYKHDNQPCSVWKVGDKELFGCECAMLSEEETESLLKSEKDIKFITIEMFLKLQKEVFGGEGSIDMFLKLQEVLSGEG